MIIDESFDFTDLFISAKDHVFRDFINECNCSATFLAQYVNYEMTKGFDRMLDDDVRNRIVAIIELLKYIYGRDLFIKAYEKEFALRILGVTPRLLNNSSISF